jgi:hypothetical protein
VNSATAAGTAVSICFCLETSESAETMFETTAASLELSCSAVLGARERLAGHFLPFKKPKKFQELDTFQEVVGRIAPERIDNGISRFIRN